MALFFTSDTHWGDHRTLNIGRRPFGSVAEMDEALVANWNAVVGPSDEVWHLGDFAVGHRDPAGLLSRLNGTKRLVAGNNDPPAIRALPGWAEVLDFAETEVEGESSGTAPLGRQTTA